MAKTTEQKIKSDTNAATQALAPYVKRLKGHFQLWNIFTSAQKMSEAYIRDFNNLSYEAKLAYTKAIIVDYAKPWSANNSKPLKSLFDDSNTINFLDSIVNTSHTHEALLQLRNKMVAHLDHGFEGLGVSIRGATIENAPPSGKQEGTLDNVFVPVSVVIENARGIWWIDDLDAIKEINSHVLKCVKETQLSLSALATEFRDTCFEYIHVLHHLSDIFEIRELTETVSDTKNHKNFDFQKSNHLNDKFGFSQPKETIFGDNKLNMLVGRYEPDPTLPSNIDIKGRGYRLLLKDNDNGTVTWNVIFPKYPYPAEAIQNEG